MNRNRKMERKFFANSAGYRFVLNLNESEHHSESFIKLPA